MGILDQINERNVGAQAQQQGQQMSMEQEQMAAAEQANAEAQKPDATQTSQGDRQRYSESYANAPEQGDITEEQAGPEEQAMHTKLEQQMIQMVHSQKQGATEGMMKVVMGANDPVQGIGTLAADIVQALKGSNPGVTQEVMLSIGERTIEELVELVELSNPRIDLTEDQMGEALSIGIQQYNQSNSDEVNDDEMREYLANG